MVKQALVFFISLSLLAMPFGDVLLAEDGSTRSSSAVPTLDTFSQENPEVEVLADHLEYKKDEKKVIAKDNVLLKYQGYRLTADYAEVYSETKEAHAKGHVLIFFKGKLRAEGENVYFNFKEQTGSFPEGQCYSGPWYVSGADIQQVRKGEFRIKEAVFTTCDGEVLPYEVRSSDVKLLVDDKMIAKNVRIYAMGKPIFWLPYLVFPLRENSLPFSVSTGHNDEDGFYIETTKGFAISENLSGKLLADWRSERGFGGGAVLDYDYGKMSRGNVIGYRSQDDNAPTVTSEENPFETRDGRDRGRVTWRHRADLAPNTFLVMRYHEASDEFVLQDFFEKEHRSEIEQQTFVTLTKNSERYGSLIHLQKRVNDFEGVVERLPELRFDWKNQPFFHEDLYYQNQFSFSNLSKKNGRSQRDEHVVRFDNFHEWSMPFKWDSINITPYLNAGGTYYSRKRFENDSTFRFYMGHGVDVRTQLYKTYDVTSDSLGIEVNGLRHVMEPVFQVDSTRVSTVSNETLEHFDTIDLVDNKDVIRFGVENRLQTKRYVKGRMRRVDIVSLNTYLSYELHPDEPSSASQFKGFEQELILRPYHWLQYEARMRYNVERNDLEVFNQDLIARMNRWRFLFGHRYTTDAALISDLNEIDSSHLFVLEASYQINPLWEVYGYLRWDGDDQDLEEWQIGAVRDWGCLLLNFGYNVRNSSIRSSNKELYFNLVLKDFPSLALRSGSGRASFSEPRIGETVAGANQLASGISTFE